MIIGIAAIIASAIIVFLSWRIYEDYFAVPKNIQADKVVEMTINSFNEAEPGTFLEMRTINDLGNDAIEPLFDRADSALIKDQWTAVVGLNTIARGLNKKDCIMHQMKAFLNSPFLTIRLYAAASLAENGDMSGEDELTKALTSDEMMMFMQPPKQAKVFAQNVLNYVNSK